MKKLIVYSGLVLFFASTASIASAAEFVVPRSSEDSSVIVATGEAHHNVYVIGSTATVNSNITGDAWVSGSSINISGDIEQDVFALGANTSVLGKVGGDFRGASGNLVFSAPIGGDVVAAGGTLIINEKASVGGDLAFAGGMAEIYAPVNGNVRFAGGSLVINSKINGNVWAQADKSIRFGPKAEVTGKVIYYSSKPANIDPMAKIGAIELKHRTASNRNLAGFLTGALLIKLVAWLLALLLLVKFLPRTMQSLGHSLISQPWHNLGFGFLGMVLAPIAIIILAAGLVGYYVAFMLLALYFTMVLFALPIAALFVGAIIIKWLTKKPQLSLDWQSALIGAAVFTVFSFIPLVGWFIIFILTLMAFGAMVRMLKDALKAS